MRFLINEDFSEDTVVLYLKKNDDDGNIDLMANDGHLTNVLLTIRNYGDFVKIPYVKIPYFRTNEEGEIEEGKL